MSEKNDTDKAFNLNNLDDLPEEHDMEISQPIEPFDAPVEPIIPEREPELFPDELLTEQEQSTDQVDTEASFTASMDRVAADPFNTHDAAAEAENSSDSASRATNSNKLPLIAIALSSVAILMQLFSSNGSDSNQERDLLLKDLEMSEQRYEALEQKLNRQIKALESKQEFLNDALQMQSRRIDSKLTSSRATPAPEVKKPTVKAPAASTTAVGWAVNLISVDNSDAAAREVKRLKARGIPVESASFYINNVLKYRIRVSGFSSRSEADQYKEKLARDYGIKDAWVYKP